MFIVERVNMETFGKFHSIVSCPSGRTTSSKDWDHIDGPPNISQIDDNASPQAMFIIHANNLVKAGRLVADVSRFHAVTLRRKGRRLKWFDVRKIFGFSRFIRK